MLMEALAVQSLCTQEVLVISTLQHLWGSLRLIGSVYRLYQVYVQYTSAEII